jgi:hypothetical protein
MLLETMNRDGFVRRFTPAPFGFVERVGDDVMIDQSTFDPMTGRIETDRTVVRDGLTRRTHHSVGLPTVNEFRIALDLAGFEMMSATDHHGAPLKPARDVPDTAGARQAGWLSETAAGTKSLLSERVQSVSGARSRNRPVQPPGSRHAFE